MVDFTARALRLMRRHWVAPGNAPGAVSATPPSNLRVVLLEDQSDDAALLVRELRRSGFTPIWQQVDTEQDYLAQLDPPPDLIIADYALPQFNGLDALRALHARGLTVPFIMVTGAMGDEEAAVLALHEGADDYLLKDRLGRLGHAVTRALGQQRLRDEKRRIDEALAGNERWFRALIEHSSDVVLLLTPDGTFGYASPATTRVLGYGVGELEGQDALAFVHPEDVSPTRSLLAQLVEAPGATMSTASRWRHKTGTWISMESTASNLLQVPGVSGIVLNCRDITDRKAAEAQLHRHAEQLHALADVSQALAEAHLDLQSVLDETVRRTAEVFGDSVTLRLVSKDTYPAVVARYPRAPEDFVRPGADSLIAVPLLAHDRVIGTLEMSRPREAAPYTCEDQRFLQDVANRAALAIENARLYQDLQEALHARDEFLSIAAHELRTPVTGIKVAAQLLRRLQEDERQDRAIIERAIGHIDAGAVRLADLTNELLDITRLQTGQLQLRNAPIDLAAILRRALKWCQLQPSGLHHFDLNGADAASWVVGDEVRVEQIVSNLLSNAVKYSPDGGLIAVRLEPAGDGYLVAVEDPGIGVPASAMEHIFEPFGRAANATRLNLPGMGLGLYICRQLAERHGGRLWAESRGEGGGTTMHLWLPSRAETDSGT
jgi:PAS domain S-box-containing protein